MSHGRLHAYFPLSVYTAHIPSIFFTHGLNFNSFNYTIFFFLSCL